MSGTSRIVTAYSIEPSTAESMTCPAVTQNQRELAMTTLAMSGEVIDQRTARWFSYTTRLDVASRLNQLWLREHDSRN